MLELRHIKKSFKKKEVLRDISMQIEEGKCIGIIGPNGSGKSTLLSIIVGVLKQDSGQVISEGDIGYVPQDNALMEELTVRDNLEFWCVANGRRIEEVLNEKNFILKLGVHSMLKERVKNLSGGMKKRINIAIALIHNPDIIILDEPCSALDIIYKNEVVEYLLQLKAEGKTILYTSHSGDEIERLCDKVYILKEGNIVREETIITLRKIFGERLSFDEIVYRLLK